ncbi:MAG: monofunctional biosynthetic peptidoglycan transglycosylase [Bacteroidetes bacterium]|nr:monofunctional biosynthetic peptidoglycan transglycosylase [Bacteroidota bacterium]
MKELYQYYLSFFLIQINRFFQWAKVHKVAAVLIGIFAIFFLQYLSLPNNRLVELRTINPKITTLMKQRIAEAHADNKPYTIVQQWIPYRNISQHLKNAVIVSEDGRFYEHEGVDWYELGESIEKNIEKGKAARGGSTISQQLVKNLFLTTSKDPIRKLKELIVTIRLERNLSKRRILEIYLNVIELGRGMFGVEAASKKYFGKSAASLSRIESAQLASIIPSPLKHQPNILSRYVERRTDIILRRMAARGF